MRGAGSAGAMREWVSSDALLDGYLRSLGRWQHLFSLIP